VGNFVKAVTMMVVLPFDGGRNPALSQMPISKSIGRRLPMNRTANLQLDVRSVPSLEEAIDQWLAARDNFKMQSTDENRHEYNATLHDLGAAWGERYPEDADTPGAFEWYRRGLIAPEED
jgi:hypothetical protein